MDWTFMRLYSQEYFITHPVLSIYLLYIYMLLLPILGLSKSLPNQYHLVFHVLDQLRSNGYSILNPISTQGCPVRPSIQGLIGWQWKNDAYCYRQIWQGASILST